ncbi:hypothetical protein DUI87_09744 [Hirundo rustica rustica]|uniref:Uncharacterized protein n=1 Tax=Hirundo rustica rustica TaxID=333673 RepID=A0A3M0KG86_HIRRU|nr:hypothetical protein DUI87_09744 [Hirundo rustica rustica]
MTTPPCPAKVGETESLPDLTPDNDHDLAKPILTTDSSYKPYRLRLTESLLLSDDEWHFVTIDSDEPGTWPQIEGFELQESKVQMMPPWRYLGLKIGKWTIVPQKFAIKTKIRTLTDVHQLCGALNWDAIKHLVQAFSFMGILKALKTDKGPAYRSEEFHSFLQQWGVEHKTGIPHSPSCERTHQEIKRVLKQQQQVLKTESPSSLLARALFTINFLNCSYKVLNPLIICHFEANQQLTMKETPPVMVNDPETERMEGPHEAVTWGCGYTCVSTPTGLRWLPSKWVRPYVLKVSGTKEKISQVSVTA